MKKGGAVKPAPFHYIRAVSVEDALSALAERPEARVLAGGQSLIAMMNLRLVKPGGALALQEADAEGIDAYPKNPAFDRLKDVLLSVFVKIGADPFAGRRAFRLLRDAGLSDVDFRVCAACARADADLSDYLPQTVLSVRAAILKFGLMTDPEIDAAVAACRAHLVDPNTITTTSTVFQAWGRKDE